MPSAPDEQPQAFGQGSRVAPFGYHLAIDVEFHVGTLFRCDDMLPAAKRVGLIRKAGGTLPKQVARRIAMQETNRFGIVLAVDPRQIAPLQFQVVAMGRGLARGQPGNESQYPSAMLVARLDPAFEGVVEATADRQGMGTHEVAFVSRASEFAEPIVVRSRQTQRSVYLEWLPAVDFVRDFALLQLFKAPVAKRLRTQDFRHVFGCDREQIGHQA